MAADPAPAVPDRSHAGQRPIRSDGHGVSAPDGQGHSGYAVLRLAHRPGRRGGMRHGGVLLPVLQPLRLHDARPAGPSGGPVRLPLPGRAVLPAAAPPGGVRPDGGGGGRPGVSGAVAPDSVAAVPKRDVPVFLLFRRVLRHVYRQSGGPSPVLRHSELSGVYSHQPGGKRVLCVSVRLPALPQRPVGGGRLADPLAESVRCPPH